jgi:hypothetical protein
MAGCAPDLSQEYLMSRAVQIDQHGGPEQMKIVDVSVGEPSA